MASEFTPSQAEVALTAKIFEKADTSKLGILTGDVAVNVFSGSKLPAGVLGEVWAMSDRENDGFLTRKGVAIALRLMGHAQRGEPVTEALLRKPGLPPTLEGYTLPILQQNTGGSASRAKSPTPAGLPQLTAQDKAKFMKIFLSCNPINGMLSGEKAGEVFVKSQLPVDKLSQIWNLADTQKRGSLDSTDFSVAMYLIQACMSGQLSFVPTSLPPGLYEQASGKTFESVIAHSTGGSSSAMGSSFNARSPSAQMQPQYTGSQPLHPQNTGPLSRLGQGPPSLPSRPSPSITNAFMQPQSTGQPQWDVTPTEKASADQFFDQLDASKRGFVEGDIVVPFMLQSNLPEDVLAQIWDLADLKNDGRLTREGFAVAMHLIQKKLAGKEIPSTLPTGLIPPSMRGNPTSPAPAPLAPVHELQDLLWDDDTPASAPLPPVLQPQRTGTMQSPAQVLQPQRTGPLSAQNTGGVQQRVASPPPQRFASPARQFSPPPTNDPFGNSSFTAPPPALAARDLLGEHEELATSPPLKDQSAEIGNVQNQLSSTKRALDTVTKDREDVEKSLQEQAVQLSTLQTQLTSAKTAYETETKLLETLRERYSAQNADINKARQELITAESDVSAMRIEKNEVQGNLLRDKEEVRDLQRKMASTGAEVETLKADIERAKKEAKQQKGLLAIAKKQLTTREAEKAKVEKELQESRAELVDMTKQREAVEEELTREVPPSLMNGHGFDKASSPDIMSMALAQPLPTTPDAAPSPPASIRSHSSKSTNPFDRLAGGGTPRSGSPFLPFATSSDIPTPIGEAAPIVTSPNGISEDPFGFSSLPTEPKQASFDDAFAAEDNEDPSTPTAETPTSPTTESRAGAASDNEDLFSTPPSTSAGRGSPDTLTKPSTSFGALDAAASQFPELAPTAPGYFPVSEPQTPNETDLSSDLKELEVDESDSSDDEQEFVVVKNDQPATSPSTTAASPPPVATNAFDDTFGFSPEPAVNAADTTPVAPFLLPSSMEIAPPAIDNVLESKAATSEAAAGKNAFDEAMGTIPTGSTTTTTTNSNFSFDSAFEDNFDFAAAKAETEKPFFPPPRSNTSNAVVSPPHAAAPLSDGFDSVFGVVSSDSAVASPPVAVAPSKSMSFDDTFGTGNSSVQSSTSAAAPPESDGLGISFDNAFGEKRLSTALAFDNAFAVPKETPKEAPKDAPAHEPRKRQMPAPLITFPSPPASPKSTSQISHTSPPPAGSTRSASPAPDLPTRNSGPKARPPASGSSLKEPATRHSRLSIRLPFGKKKKQDSTPPVPRGSHLSPPPEESVGVDEDIDTVKQLTAMGFSRDESVGALERNSYDFQRALNSLLGTQ